MHSNEILDRGVQIVSPANPAGTQAGVRPGLEGWDSRTESTAGLFAMR